MANDTDFSLVFLCPTQQMLTEVVNYVKRIADTYFDLSYHDVDEIGVDQFGRASLWVTVWVPRTSHFFLDELADLLKRFPFLTITGTFDDTYGSGRIEGSEQT